MNVSTSARVFTGRPFLDIISWCHETNKKTRSILFSFSLLLTCCAVFLLIESSFLVGPRCSKDVDHHVLLVPITALSVTFET